jgi:CII-binding regulator of phage lambda lysogenization HflD
LLKKLKKLVRSKNINEDEDAYIQLIYKYRYANYENFNNIYKYYENILEYFQFLYQEKDRKYRKALESMGNIKDAPLEKESNILDTLPEVLKITENKLKYIDDIKSNIEEDLAEIYPITLTS